MKWSISFVTLIFNKILFFLSMTICFLSEMGKPSIFRWSQVEIIFGKSQVKSDLTWFKSKMNFSCPSSLEIAIKTHKTPTYFWTWLAHFCFLQCFCFFSFFLCWKKWAREKEREINREKTPDEYHFIFIEGNEEEEEDYLWINIIFCSILMNCLIY
jgi:hypothetical protein